VILAQEKTKKQNFENHNPLVKHSHGFSITDQVKGKLKNKF